MEDVSAAGDVGQGLALAGPQARAEVGDGRFRSETPFAQLQQANAPGVGVAAAFGGKQVAVAGMDVGPNQNRLSLLEDLVVRADADGGQILSVVDRLGPRDGLA